MNRISLTPLTRKKSNDSSLGTNSSGRSSSTRKAISEIKKQLKQFVKEGVIIKPDAKKQFDEFKRYYPKTQKKLPKIQNSSIKEHLKKKEKEFEELKKQGFTTDEIAIFYNDYKKEYLKGIQPISTKPTTKTVRSRSKIVISQNEDIKNKIKDLFKSVLKSKRHTETPFGYSITVLSQHGTGNAMCGVYALFNIILQNETLSRLITRKILARIVEDFQRGFNDFAGDASQIESGGWFDAGEVNLVLRSLSQIASERQLPRIQLTDMKSARQDLTRHEIREWGIDKSWNFFTSSDKPILGAVIIRSGHYYGLVYKNGVYYLLNSFEKYIEILTDIELETRFPFFDTQIMVICSQ
jgi:hypothetical protein